MIIVLLIMLPIFCCFIINDFVDVAAIPRVDDKDNNVNAFVCSGAGE